MAANIAELLRSQRDEILRRWVEAISELRPAEGLRPTVLLDHMPQILARFAEILDGLAGAPPSRSPTLTDIHAVERLDVGFDLSDVVSEYTMLRRCILEIAQEDGERVGLRDVIALDRAIDDAVAVAVDRYTQARDRTLRALDRISTAALQSRDLDAFLHDLLAVLVDTTSAVDTAAIMLRDGGRLVIRASVGLEGAVEQRFSVPLGEGFAGTIATSGRPSFTGSAETDPTILGPFIRERGVKALYGVPLHGERHVIGVAHMGSRSATSFADADRRLFDALAARASAAIAQHALHAEVDRRRAELEAVIEAIPDGVFIGTAERMNTVNRAGLALLGIDDPEELSGDKRFELMRRLDLAVTSKNTGWGEENGFDLALLGETTQRELTFRNVKTGRETIVRTASAPIRLDGAIIGAVSVNTDITELKRLQHDRAQFIGMVVHDLRNPIAGSRSLAQLLVRDRERAGDNHNAVRAQRLVAQLDRTNRLLDDLLAVTLAEQDRLELDRRDVDYAELVQELTEVWRSAATAHTIEVEVPAELRLTIDRDRIGQVLENLFSNALKYSPTGGVVKVAVVVEGDEAITSISDQGIGIAPEDQPNLFQAYHRVPTGKRIKGHGLGLYVVAQIVRAHGGRVFVESEPGVGSRFSFALPLRRQ